MTSLLKSVPRREHKERSQLRSRQRFGLLEKKKDYVLRARDYHSKQKRLGALRQRARERNPDEFYFSMENQKTKDGVHITERNEKFSEEFLKLLKTQDIGYIRHQRDVNKKKLERLRADLHFTEENKSSDVAAVSVASTSGSKASHTIFVDDEEDVKKFNPAKHFGTAPELVGRTFNRPRLSDLSEQKLNMPSKKELKKMTRGRAALLKEYESRIEREEQLKKVEQEMNIQKALMSKGRRKKVGKDEKGLPVYKWRAERKK
ncbi:hypothetical protein H4219_000914 [Mycoemilia scoparia]|uniref:U3 small nucleolar RNA-associated protein 11 n=1 Tax=Mycoemilia scoparia TaxID=417184 RepID=A0A9W8DSH9_9FUNG|nr:hypothetical protein H4219_000914 [Mycoemilia scoparia]